MKIDISKIPTNTICRLMGTCPMYLQWFLILASMTEEHNGYLRVSHRDIRLTKHQTAFTLSSLRQRLAWVSATGKEIRPQYKELRRFLALLEELGLLRVKVNYNSVHTITFVADYFDAATREPYPSQQRGDSLNNSVWSASDLPGAIATPERTRLVEALPRAYHAPKKMQAGKTSFPACQSYL